MFTLRCTKRLLKRLPAPRPAQRRDTTTRLGDWYANLVFVGRAQLALCVNERTLIAVVLPASPARTLVPRLAVEAGVLLKTLGISEADADGEAEEMSEAMFDVTTNRRVIGIMVDFAKATPFYLDDGMSLRALSEQLSHTPCSPVTGHFPDLAAIAVFGEGRARVH